MENEINKIKTKLTELEKRVSIIEKQLFFKKMPLAPIEKEDVTQKIISSKIDMRKYAHFYRLSPLPLFLNVLKMALDEFGIDGLTPTEISKVLAGKIRIPKGTDRTAISHMLADAREYVDRCKNPRGRGYIYRLMKDGEDFLQEEIKKKVVVSK